MHGHPFEAFVPAISQIARFCGMRWVDPPMVVHGAHRLSPEELRETAANYRRRIAALASEVSPQPQRTEPQAVEHPHE
jgi:glutathione-regulated potassium-efflux system ancillary protein KefF